MPRITTVAKKEPGRPTTVDEYISRLDPQVRKKVEQIRSLLLSVVPGDAVEVISYGIPAFRSSKVLVWYAGFSRHVSLFPTASVIEAFKNELEDYTISKGTIQFPLDQSLPTALIRKIVKARVKAATSA